MYYPERKRKVILNLSQVQSSKNSRGKLYFYVNLLWCIRVQESSTPLSCYSQAGFFSPFYSGWKPIVKNRKLIKMQHLVLLNSYRVNTSQLWIWHLKFSSKLCISKAVNKLTKDSSLHLKIMLQIDSWDHTREQICACTLTHK